MAPNTATMEQGSLALPENEVCNETANSQSKSQIDQSGNDALPGLEEALLCRYGDNRGLVGGEQTALPNLRSEVVNGDETILDSTRNPGRNRADSGVSQSPGDGSELVELFDQSGESGMEPVEKDATSGKRTVPQVATKNVLQFATRGKTGKPKPAVKSTSNRATRGKFSTAPTVEDVKASKGTWAFRLRWNSEPGRPVVYVRRVTDAVHNLIREENYDAFKKQLISSHSEATLRASRNAG